MENDLKDKTTPITYEDMLKKIDAKIAQLEKEESDASKISGINEESVETTKNNSKKLENEKDPITYEDLVKSLDEKIAKLEKEEAEQKNSEV